LAKHAHITPAPRRATTRQQLEGAIEAAIFALDAFDGDPDPELVCEDEGGACEDEGGQCDDEGDIEHHMCFAPEYFMQVAP
jgi:hypothetical protein